MIKKIILLLLSFFMFVNTYASNKIVLPPKKITYHCSCETPSKTGICEMYLNNGTKKAPASAFAKPFMLNGGWIVQPINCVNHKTYHLTAGSKLFNGKVLVASYGHLKVPVPIKGYVYRVTPNLPYSKKISSVTIVKNPAISGIDLSSKNTGWRCGVSGNRLLACHSKITIAQCFKGRKCNFIYKK